MNRILLMALIIIYLCSGVLPLSAQQNSTLKDAVRDQYLEKIDEDGLSQIENSANLSSLDPYSHFLTEKELVATLSRLRIRIATCVFDCKEVDVNCLPDNGAMMESSLRSPSLIEPVQFPVFGRRTIAVL